MKGFRIVCPNVEWGAKMYVNENNGNKIPEMKKKY